MVLRQAALQPATRPLVHTLIADNFRRTHAVLLELLGEVVRDSLDAALHLWQNDGMAPRESDGKITLTALIRYTDAFIVHVSML